jgi:hypothetical protein
MKKYLSVVITIFALTACSTFKVNYHTDPQTEFSRYHTYAFYSDEIAHSISTVFGVTPSTLDSAVKSSIRAQLQSKGFTRESTDAADIWINYETVAEPTIVDRYQYKLEDLNQSYKSKQIRFSSSLDANRRYPSMYDKGIIIVDVIDRDALKVVWRGTVELPMGVYGSESERVEAIQNAVRKLLKKFPP